MNKSKVIAKQKPNNRIQISSVPKPQSVSTVHNIKLSNPKLDSINKTLMTKLDSILLDYPMYDNLVPDFQNSISTNPQSEIVYKVEEFHPPLSAHSKKLPKITKKPSKKIQKNQLQHSNNIDGTFMTGAGLKKLPKKNPKKRTNKFLAKADEEINDILKNIDDIDNMFKSKDKDDISFEGSPEFRRKMEKDMEDFKDLIAEIDGYRDELKENFDEIQYLIKFADNTHNLIDRHKNVIGSIFKGAGLQTRSQMYGEHSVPKDNNKRNYNLNQTASDKESNSDSDEYRNKDMELGELTGVFNKMKKINQIKNNLGNIQDSFLDYHEKLKESIKRSQSAKRPIVENKID